MIEDKEKLFYELVKKDYIENNTFGYLSQMSVIVIKSLIPSIKSNGNIINYERYIKEMDLWMYYRNNDNEALLNIKNVDEEKYWSCLDDSIIGRVIPILIVNENIDLILDEVIKNILFTTGNIRTLMEYMMIVYLFKLIIDGVEMEKALDYMKNYIINFTQKGFIEKYQSFYRVPINTYDGNYKIDFEKEKIRILNILNMINIEYNSSFQEALNIYMNNVEDINYIESKILKDFLYNSNDSENVDIPKFYIDLGIYMKNLRKGRISREDLYVKDYKLPDIFQFNKGDKFYHTLLNISEIVKREEDKRFIKVLVKSKSGYYLFKKNK